ncbi:MAG: phage holin family protein, partial [Betaproteobacteria bacterium]|nr:phage holin family protein [Betaproteobacteria bacterium]
MTDRTAPGSRRGLRSATVQLAESLLGLGRTRLELAAVEFEEARARASERLVLVLIAGLCFALAVLAASMLVVVLFWDTHRIAALCGVTIVYALLGLAALWRLAAQKRSQ